MNIESKYIWLNGKFIPWDEAKDHIIIHGLHYGTSVFEGIRFYNTDDGVGIFRLKDHINRLFYSMQALGMKIDFSREDIINACKETVRINEIENGYIRPIVWYGYGKMGLKPKGAKVNISISVWPWGKYLSERPINVKISKFTRLAPSSVVIDAKVGGYYVNSVFANSEVVNQGFDEALLLDIDGYIAEGPGENIFFIKGNDLITPALGSILPGITRNTIIEAVAPYLGLNVIERKIKPEELDNFDEAFFVGTAAEVTPIGFITDLNNNTFEYIVSKGEKIRQVYMDIVHGKIEQFKKYIDLIK